VSVPRLLMIDVDGVLVRPPAAGRWDVELGRDLDVDPDVLQREFFDPHFQTILRGDADLIEVLGEVLPSLGTPVSPRTLVDYWFTHDAHLDGQLVSELRRIRSTGIEVHLATDQEHRRAEFLWITCGLREQFDGMHYSAALGHTKPTAEFFESITGRVGAAGHEILFVDDRLVNVRAARTAGWAAIHWTSPASIETLRAAVGGDPARRRHAAEPQ
jgi:putative hydrolase of the HAD superfamily